MIANPTRKSDILRFNTYAIAEDVILFFCRKIEQISAKFRSSIVTAIIGLTYTNKIWARSIIILCPLDCQTLPFNSMLYQIVLLPSDSVI